MGGTLFSLGHRSLFPGALFVPWIYLWPPIHFQGQECPSLIQLTAAFPPIPAVKSHNFRYSFTPFSKHLLNLRHARCQANRGESPMTPALKELACRDGSRRVAHYSLHCSSTDRMPTEYQIPFEQQGHSSERDKQPG